MYLMYMRYYVLSQERFFNIDKFNIPITKKNDIKFKRSRPSNTTTMLISLHEQLKTCAIKV